MGILQKKCRTTRKKTLAYRGKGGQKYRYCFSCPKVRGGFLLSNVRVFSKDRVLRRERFIEGA